VKTARGFFFEECLELGVFLEDLEVVDENLFNWEVVRVVCEGEEGTVFLFKGGLGG
jgi:hypothetical protein